MSRDKSVTTCEGTFFFIAGIVILGGVALVVSRFVQKSVRWSIEDGLVATPNSTMVHEWTHPTVPVYMKFYVFNVTNGGDILRGEKPILEEHGPYTYRMLSPRFDIKFYVNDTVTFRNNNTMYFEPDLSSGSEDDVLFHINIPVVTVMGKLASTPRFLKKVYHEWARVLGDGDLVVPHTVKEIIFGYQEPMFKAAKGIMSLVGKNIDEVFGPFHGFNNSDDGLFLVKTGKGNFSDFNRIERWNGKKSLSFWSTKYANMLNGTDGSFLQPNLDRNRSTYLYFPQMHRSIELEYEEDTVIKGISTYRYHFARDLLKNATADPDNKGFCVPINNCFDSGLLNVGTFKDESAPMFLSLPHFYGGSERLQRDIVGLRPNKSLHDSFFHVEPMTGAVMLGQRRLQINTHLTGSEYFNEMTRVRPVFFPYLWLSGEAMVDDKTAGQLHTAMMMVSVARFVGYIVIGVGITMLLGTLLRRYKRRRAVLVADEEPLISADQDA